MGLSATELDKQLIVFRTNILQSFSNLLVSSISLVFAHRAALASSLHKLDSFVLHFVPDTTTTAADELLDADLSASSSSCSLYNMLQLVAIRSPTPGPTRLVIGSASGVHELEPKSISGGDTVGYLLSLIVAVRAQSAQRRSVRPSKHLVRKRYSNILSYFKAYRGTSPIPSVRYVRQGTVGDKSNPVARMSDQYFCRAYCYVSILTS